MANFLNASSESSGEPKNDRVWSLIHLVLIGARQSSLRVGKSFSRSDCRFTQPDAKFLKPPGVI